MVGGIGTHIVCSVGYKSSYAASETACAATIGGVAVVDGREMGCAPANTTSCDGSPAIRGDIAAADGGCFSYIYTAYCCISRTKKCE